ncbi:hypothetical protein [Gordonia malaquae]|uniref:hypothetical protein n=1 Tax=Gordonia malaquae TaxID=410332 RepID=UPI0030FDFC6C
MDDWIDTVAERVETRLDRGVGVAARRILQSQSLMEVLAWLLVLYMEQRQQAAELHEWTADKRATMTAPVERPLSGPLAALSDDAIRFLSTHEDGATAGYEQFAEERYEAYAGRKRAAGEVPRPMADTTTFRGATRCRPRGVRPQSAALCRCRHEHSCSRRTGSTASSRGARPQTTVYGRSLSRPRTSRG